jgi:hypothetical protein
VAHQYGHDDRIPERPPAPELSLRAEVEFERRRVEHAALLAKFAEYEALKAKVERLQWEREAACENTPTKGCECPGCCTARERAGRGEA